nr:ATP-binding protein [Neorhizobium sp. SHOUNA12B]
MSDEDQKLRVRRVERDGRRRYDPRSKAQPASSLAFLSQALRLSIGIDAQPSAQVGQGCRGGWRSSAGSARSPFVPVNAIDDRGERHHEIIGDPVVATARLDRLLHHSAVITIRGDSYRLRESAVPAFCRRLERRSRQTKQQINEGGQFFVI